MQADGQRKAKGRICGPSSKLHTADEAGREGKESDEKGWRKHACQTSISSTFLACPPLAPSCPQRISYSRPPDSPRPTPSLAYPRPLLPTVSTPPAINSPAPTAHPSFLFFPTCFPAPCPWLAGLLCVSASCDFLMLTALPPWSKRPQPGGNDRPDSSTTPGPRWRSLNGGAALWGGVVCGTWEMKAQPKRLAMGCCTSSPPPPGHWTGQVAGRKLASCAHHATPWIGPTGRNVSAPARPTFALIRSPLTPEVMQR
jgi:hypothetical protein